MRFRSIFNRRGNIGAFAKLGRKEKRIKSRQLRVEPLEHRHLLSAVSIAATNPNDGTADTFRLVRNGANLEIYIDGVLDSAVEYSTIDSITVQGSSDDDTLMIDVSGGLIDVSNIDFDGEALGVNSGPTGDVLYVTGNPGAPIGRVSYGPMGSGAGLLVYDPNDNMGPGGGVADGDEMIIMFSGLSPVFDTVPADQLDIFGTSAADTIEIVDGPGVFGVQTTEVRETGGLFESIAFANKTRTTVNGMDGADRVIINFSAENPGLQYLDIYGSELTGGAIIPDDAQGETIEPLATAPGLIATRVYGQNGSELITNAATNYLDAIRSRLELHGQFGSSIVRLHDTADPTGDNVTITGNTITGAAEGDIALYFATVELLDYRATSGDDTIDILSTFSSVDYIVSGGAGNDTFTVGATSGTAGTGVGSLAAIDGNLSIEPGEGVDTLTVDASGDLNSLPDAWIRDESLGLAHATILEGFAEGQIQYTYTVGVDQLEGLTIYGPAGGNTIDVQATTAANTVIHAGNGDDAHTVWLNGDGLSGNTVVLGDDGVDRVVVNVTNDLGADSVFPLTAFLVHGGDPGGTSQRDVLEFNDYGFVSRNVTFRYDDIGTIQMNGFALPMLTTGFETIRYAGDGRNDDTVTLLNNVPTATDITVAPLSGTQALVFVDGDPWDGPDLEGSYFDQYPGLAGGGRFADLLVSGVDTTAGITVNAGTALGNRLYVLAPSEDDLVDPATTIDPFGFGAGVIVPGFGAGNAYDALSISDSLIAGTNISAGDLVSIHPVAGTLLPVLFGTPSLILNTGFEASPSASGASDVIYADLTGVLSMRVNAGDPDPNADPSDNIPPDGDKLMWSTFGDVDIWATAGPTPTVTVSSGFGTPQLKFSSVEQFDLDVGHDGELGTVNIYGDNNNGLIDQPDKVVLRGADVDSMTGGDLDGTNEVLVSINGSGDLAIRNVGKINVFGDDRSGTPSTGNDVDTLVVTPYADDTTAGWGIDISFDEGNPVDDNAGDPDLIVYNAVPGVSEDILLAPSGAGDGQLRVTNAADGSAITVIDYVSNTGFIVNGNDGSQGDVDSLTVRGTETNNIFTIDGTTIDVAGVLSADYTNFDVVNAEGAGGVDLFNVTPSTVQVNIDGGTPDGTIQSAGDILSVDPGAAPFGVELGPDGDQGTLSVLGNAPISFDRLEALMLGGALYTLPDLNEPNDSLADPTVLGSLPNITIRDLSIHSNQLGTTNEDYYQITAHDSGALLVSAYFTPDGTPGNAVGGTLHIELLDSLGNLIAAGAVVPGGESLAVPVVSQEKYYLHVVSLDGDPNTYDLEIENFAAPAPTGVEIHPAHDSGRLGTDNITNIETPQVLIQAWLSDLAAKGVPVLTAAQAAAGTPGVAVEVFVNGTSAGFADPLGASNNLFAFTLPPAVLAGGLPGGYTGDPTAFGYLNFVSAAVRVIDGQAVPHSASQELSTPLSLTYDPQIPDITIATLNLVPTSDSAVVGDGVTQVNAPAFQGVAEANSIVRLYADDQLVGQTIAGSDATDGIIGNGLGTWEITSEPLADKVTPYTMTIQLEDVAGNVTDRADSPIVQIVIDTLIPEQPTVDLLNIDDTGSSEHDNITQGSVVLGDGIVTLRYTADRHNDVYIKDGDRVIAGPFNTGVGNDGTVVIDFHAAATLTTFPVEGPHQMSVEAVDLAGNHNQSEPLLITIDFTPPVAPTMALAAYADSGTPGDGLTSVAAPAVTGLAEANSIVRVYADDGNGPVLAGIGIAQSDESDGNPADGLGIWEITLEPLADGTYTLTAESEDLAGNISEAGEPIQIVIDTTGPQRPTVDLLDSDDTGSSDLDNVTIGDPTQGDAIVDIRITSDPGTVVDLKDGNTVIMAGIPIGPSGETVVTVDFNAAALVSGFPAEGPHPLSAEAYDAASNRAQSHELLVTIDNTAPPATMPMLADYSDSGAVGDGITSVVAPAFHGLAEANATVRLFADSGAGPVLIGETVAGSDESDGVPTDGLGVWEITSEPLTDGSYTIWAEVEDLAGNVSDAQDNVLLALAVTIDATAPQRPTIDLIDADDTGEHDKDNVTIGDPTQGDAIVDVRISAEFGSTVRIKDGETIIDSFTFDAAFDLTDGVVDGFGVRTIDFNAVETTYNIPAEGPHPLSTEAVDAAGNFTQSEELLVTIDHTAPDAPSTPDLLADSDSGAFHDDNVTNINAPAFSGTGEANAIIRIYAQSNAGTQLVGIGRVGSDESDGVPTDGLGVWEVTIEPLDDGVYSIWAELEDQAGNVSDASRSLVIEIDTAKPNTPYLDLLAADDSGRSNVDNITNVATPRFSASTHDPNAGAHILPDNYRFRIYDRSETGGEVLVYDSGALGSASSLTTPALGAFADGVHNFKLEVEDRAGNISDDFLLPVTIDTIAPPVSIGTPALASDGLHPDSNSGVDAIAFSLDDVITNDTVPSFWGVSEADAFIRMSLDVNYSGTLDIGDPNIGEAVTIPVDGNQAQYGQWELTSLLNFNDPTYLSRDGTRRVFAQAIDVAGNVSDVESFEFFLDTQGPQITGVAITDDPGTPEDESAFNLFNPKPTDGPTPLITSLSIDVRDLPNREALVAYTALANDPGSGLLAEALGNFSLVGDANGEIPIASVEFLSAPVVVGNPATGTLVLHFAEPLPDDRYTLTVSDNLTDIAGNKLDGESNASEPQDPPSFPSGDGNNGGDFVARFTVDSRPELGTWAAGQIWVDTNGNEVFDPENPDYTNRDLTYVMGYAADDIFAGNFGREVADGFDKLAAYGRFGDNFRWLIDLDNDGVADIEQYDPANVNGLPVAGRFDDNDLNGDEVAVVTAFPAAGNPSIWYFDTDHDFLVDTTLTSELRGYPIVGDFDGDGFDDLATWMDNRFQVDLANGVRRGWDGVADYTFGFGFPGVRERPVAADFDQDGFDDFGLWSPDSTGETPTETANWYILVSAGRSVLDRITTDPISGQPVVEFSPSPLGQDWYAHFGDNFAVPVVGNFDPPVVPQDNQPEPIVTNVIQIDGTPGADRFEFTAGASPDSWVVKLNGQTIAVDPTATGVHFVGQGGDDVVVYTGSTGADIVDLASGRATFDFDGFTLEVSGVSLYSVDTGAGFDEVTMRDTPADEWLVAWTDTASMRSDLTEQVVTGYEKLTAIAADGGQDVALLYDSPGNDTFIGTPDRVVMSGEGYSLEAVDFDYAHGMRTQGGNDIARLYDSPGNDILEGRQLYTRILGDGFFVRAKQFPVVEAYAVAGGMDVASLTDTPGDETFTADPSGAELTGEGYTIRVAGFDYNHGYGRFGGNDVAHLYDTPGDDRVQVMYRFAKIMGTDYFARAKYFKNTLIHTSTGNDTAVVLDTKGDDFFTASASDFKLVTPKETFQGFGFDDVNAIAKYGGQDVAFLFDSAGDDTFVGEGSIGQMSGEGYHLRAAAFEYIHAYSRSGHDVAYLKGTGGDDTLNARSTYATLVGANYFLRAKAFDVLYAEGGEGNDTARLFGTSGNESVTATRTEIMMQGSGFTHRTNGFENVYVNGAGGTDQATSDGAVVGGQFVANSLNTDLITQLAVLSNFDRLEAKNVPPQQTNEVHEAVDAVFSLYWEN